MLWKIESTKHILESSGNFSTFMYDMVYVTNLTFDKILEHSVNSVFMFPLDK